jgi:hypothetical protein
VIYVTPDECDPLGVFLVMCPWVAGAGLAFAVGLIRSLSPGWGDPSQSCRSGSLQAGANPGYLCCLEASL